MQYTNHYNLNLPEGTDIVNPLIQDNPNYSAIDTALYNNKLRVIGNATHVKTGTNHAITLGDSDINQFKFVATGDYASGDTFTVDGVTVTARIADGSSIPGGAFKINSTVLCILDGTLLNLINVDSVPNPNNIILSNGESVESAIVKGSVSVTGDGVKSMAQILNELFALVNISKISGSSTLRRGYLNTRNVFQLYLVAPDGLIFNRCVVGSATYTNQSYNISAASSYYENANDLSYIVPGNGEIIEIIY